MFLLFLLVKARQQIWFSLFLVYVLLHIPDLLWVEAAEADDRESGDSYSMLK